MSTRLDLSKLSLMDALDLANLIELGGEHLVAVACLHLD